jgi:RNA polymerase sigma-70 factor (ECF subfamily)
MTAERRIRDFIREAQAGDRRAFEQLMGIYEDRVRSAISRRLEGPLNPALEADDILQEVMVAAFKAIHRFEWRGEDSFHRWLCGIAQNLVLHQSRQQRRIRKISLHQEVAANNQPPSESARREERFDRLEAALEQLSPDYRQVIVLARIQGLPVKEIARKMNRSPKAVYQLLWRALKRLRVVFGETDSFSLPPRSIDTGGRGDGP